MRIVESLKNIDINELTNHEEFYSKNENVYFKFYKDNLYIWEMENAMKVGKEVIQYCISNISISNFIENFFDYLYELQIKNIVEFISRLKKGQIKETEALKIKVSTQKGVRVFSPFYVPKPIKVPSKWKISHIVKAILSGQISKGQCEQKLSDDYSFDAATNFGKKPLNILEFCKELVEDPSGWWTHEDEKSEYPQLKKLSVNLHSFNYNSVYFDLNAKPRVVEFEHVVEHVKEFNLKYFNEGINCFNNKEYKRAIEMYEKSIALNENKSSSMYNAAVCCIKIKQYEKAISFLKPAIKMKEDSKYYFNLGYCYALTKNDKKALICFNKAWALNNDDSECEKAISLLLNKLKKS